MPWFRLTCLFYSWLGRLHQLNGYWGYISHPSIQSCKPNSSPYYPQGWSTNPTKTSYSLFLFNPAVLASISSAEGFCSKTDRSSGITGPGAAWKCSARAVVHELFPLSLVGFLSKTPVCMVSFDGRTGKFVFCCSDIAGWVGQWSIESGTRV